MSNKSGPGFVYAVFDHLTGLTKIGYSADPCRRVRQLATGCAGVLELVWQERGWPNNEREMHVDLKSRHVRGEWFDLSPRHDRRGSGKEAHFVAGAAWLGVAPELCGIGDLPEPLHDGGES